MDVKSMSRDAILEWVAEFEEAGFKLASESEDRIEIEHERGSVIATWNGSAWELSGENAAARDALMKVVARAVDRTSSEDARLAKRNGNGNGGTKSIAVQPPMPEPQELTLETIKKYLCPEATDQEAYIFLQLCNTMQSRLPGLEFSILIRGTWTEQGFILSKDYIIPKQRVTPASVDYTEDLAAYKKDGYNTVIHSHPFPSSSFSYADDEAINAHFDCSLLFSERKFAAASVRIQLTPDLQLRINPETVIIDDDVTVDVSNIEIVATSMTFPRGPTYTLY